MHSFSQPSGLTLCLRMYGVCHISRLRSAGAGVLIVSGDRKNFKKGACAILARCYYSKPAFEEGAEPGWVKTRAFGDRKLRLRRVTYFLALRETGRGREPGTFTTGYCDGLITESLERLSHIDPSVPPRAIPPEARRRTSSRSTICPPPETEGSERRV